MCVYSLKPKRDLSALILSLVLILPGFSLKAQDGTTRQILSGSYTWADADNTVIESEVIYEWDRSDDNPVTNKTEIAAATSLTYPLVAADAVNHISLEVTPSEGTDGAAVESSAQEVNTPLNLQSVVRQTPTTSSIKFTTNPVFRVTFSDGVRSVDADDFVLNSTVGGTINTVTAVNSSTYDVTVNSLDNDSGTLSLKVKGIDGATGSNDITRSTATHQQTAQNDFLNHALLGQSFTAASNNDFTAFTLFPRSGEHSFTGTARLRVFQGDASSAAVLADANAVLSTETVDISNSTSASGQTYTISDPTQLTSGSVYSIVLDNFTGSGSRAFNAHTSGSLANGSAFFTNSSAIHAGFDLNIEIFEGAVVIGEGLATSAPQTSESYTLETIVVSIPDDPKPTNSRFFTGPIDPSFPVVWSDGTQIAEAGFDFNPQLFRGPQFNDPKGIYTVDIKVLEANIFPQSRGYSVGLMQVPSDDYSHDLGTTADEWGYRSIGEKENNGVGEAFGAEYEVGDIVRIHYNAVTEVLNFYLKKAGQTEFVKQGTDDAYTNVKAASGGFLHAGASIKCIASCKFELVENEDFAEIDVKGIIGFGQVNVDNASATQSFTIENNGKGRDLTLSGTSNVTISGADAADFSVVTQPSGTISVGSSSNFTIKFDPTTGGTKTATVTISSNDEDEGDYTFKIKGTAIQTNTAPVQKASNAVLGASTTSSINIASFTAASDADGYVIKARDPSFYSTTTPTDGNALPSLETYTGSSEKVVYAGTSITPNIMLNNLQPNTDHALVIYAYKLNGGNYIFQQVGYEFYACTNDNDVPITSIVRQTPTDATTDVDQVIFRVTFAAAVTNVDATDFALSGTAAGDGTIGTVNAVSTSIYDVTVTGVTNSNGTINLDIKGNNGVTGTNNIQKLSEGIQYAGQSSGGSLTGTELGASFVATRSGRVHKALLRVTQGMANATFKIYEGEGFGGTLVGSVSMNVSNAGYLDIPGNINLTAGTVYTWSISHASILSILASNVDDYPNYKTYVDGAEVVGRDIMSEVWVEKANADLSTTAPGTDETFTILNNTAPTATNVSITGTLKSGQQVTGTYTWADADNDDTESGSTFKWYRSDDAAGTGKTQITGATTVNYTLTNDDINKFISFEVTPNDGTTAGTPVESTRSLLATVFITSIARQTPTDGTTNADEVTFRVTFSADVARLSADDLVLSGTVAGDGTISSITRVNDQTYDIKVTGIDLSEGTINLDLKGVDGAGTNNIIKLNQTQDASQVTAFSQHSDGDTFIWQSFIAEQTGLLNSVTLKKLDEHTYEGTATLSIYTGEGTGGTLVATQQVFTSKAEGDETYYFDLPGSITQGSQYTWHWEEGTGTGASAWAGKNNNAYVGGRGLSQQFPAITTLDWFFIVRTITGALEPLGATAPSTDETYTIVNPPVANNVAIAGTGAIGQQLTGSYTYSDPHSDAESGTTFRWLRADDANGTGKTAIGSATTTTYTVQAADAGKFLIFEVTASDGTKTGDPTESAAKQIQLPLSVQSIARHTPTTENITSATDPVFRVTFSENADNVTVDDFVLNSTAGGTISSFNAVDGKTYDLTVNSLNNVDGTLGLKVKGIDGATGTNDINTFEFANGAATHQQTTENDFLNQALIGQSFTAASNNFLTAFTLFAKAGNHTFSGTARLRILEGDASNSTVLNDANAVLTTETVNISNSTDAAGQTFSITTPAQLTSGTAYSIVLDLFTGSGNRAFFAHTSGSLAGGRAFFTGSHNGHAAFDFMIDIFENPKVIKNLFDQAPGTDETYTVEQDLVKPTVTITSDASDPHNGAFTATFTFSEDVTGFAADDITVGNGAASNFQTTSAKVYTATITPTATGEVTIDVAADKAQDLVGNNNTAATQLSVTNDQTAPTVTSVSATTADGSYKEGDVIDITVTFSEDVDVNSGPIQLFLELGDNDFTVDMASESNGVLTFSYTVSATDATSDLDVVSGSASIFVNSGSIKDAAGNDAVLTLPDPGTANSLSDNKDIVLDNVDPTVTITSTNTSGAALVEFPITITFSESVTDFVEGDITISNGTVKTGTFSGSGSTYTATIEGTNHGTVTVDVAADKASDAAGNGNTAATQFSIENDVISPSVTITSDAANPQSGAFTATFTFNENVTDFVVGDISVGNGAASNFNATSAKVYTATITPTADGNVTIDVPVLAAKDVAGNFSNPATQLVVVNDETKPTVTITSSADPTSGVFTATFTFSEDVTGFTSDDISVGNGAASNFNATSAKVYTAAITPAADGAVTIDVAADKAADAAGNGNTAATQLSVTNDETKPTVTITSGADRTSGAFTATFTFSEDVFGFGVGGITLGNGVASNFSSISATVYTATITPSADGLVTIDVAADQAFDNPNNGNSAATQLSVINDETKPTVTTTSDANDPQIGAFTATFTFSEDVTGFVVGDISVGNGAASNFNATSAKVYTATITPAADGAVTIDVAADKANDAAGNGNTAATQLSVTNDESKPTVTITASANPTSGAFTATFTFDEDVTGFEVGDIVVGNGAASNFSTTSATVYTATITPVTDGGVTIDVAADKAQDAAGNSNKAANQLSVTNDETKPTVTVTSDANDPQSGAFTATFTFSEDVTGFTSDDISVGNGAATNFSATSATVYTATITPVTDGAVTIDVAADKAEDAAGNSNMAATQLSVTNDETKPTVTISSDANDPQSGAFTATFTFSEDVTGFTSDDISVGNGSASNFSTTSATVYTATITPVTDGGVTIDVAADKAEDAAGNSNTAANQLSVTNDETKPTVTVTSDANDPQSRAFTATFTFSEDVTGFTSDDISVGNGAASNFNATSTTVYTATITPGAEGAVTIDVAADKAQDAAGNSNTAATQLSVTNDETRPTVTITASADPTSGAFTATFTFSEDVTGFASDDISVGNGTAGNFNTTSASLYTATITPSAEGAVTIDVAADKAVDAAGNGNIAAVQLSVMNDETQPTVTITSKTNNPTNQSFDVVITFSEDVTGFAIDDITVGNGAASNFSATSTTEYTATITPSADGVVTVDIAADKASDDAGNGNSAATQLSITFDSTAPTAVITTTVNDPTNSNPIPITVTFSEEMTGIEEADLTAGGATISDFATADNTVFTLNLIPTADGTITLDLSAGAGTDQAGNPNTAATQFTIESDQTKPEITISEISGDDLIEYSENDDDLTVSGTVTGVAEGQAINLSLNSDTRIYNTTAEAGAWSVTIPVADFTAFLADNELKATVADAAGNVAEATRSLQYQLSQIVTGQIDDVRLIKGTKQYYLDFKDKFIEAAAGREPLSYFVEANSDNALVSLELLDEQHVLKALFDISLTGVSQVTLGAATQLDSAFIDFNFQVDEFLGGALFIQDLNPSGGITSQSFGDLGGTVLSADDFTVPAGETWTIEKLRALGSKNENDFTEVEVYILANDAANNVPGDTLHQFTLSDIEIDRTGQGGNLTLDFPENENVQLSEGTYWIGVTPILDFDGNAGRWFWSRTTEGTGNNYQLIDPANLFGAGYTDWTDGSDVSAGLPHLSFRLIGTSDAASLTEPENLMVQVKDTSSLTVSWSTAEGVSLYRVKRGLTETDLTETYLLDPGVADELTVDEFGLEPNTQYFYGVTPQGSITGPEALISALTYPAIPEVLDASNIANYSFVANWQGVSTDAYQLEVSEQSDFGSVLVTESIDGMTTSKLIEGLKLGTDYYYRVSAINKTGSLGYSDVKKVTTQQTPVILDVEVPADGVYGIGQQLDAIVTYDQPVVVSGAPTIGLIIGSNTVEATWDENQGSALTFSYTVKESDLDEDGILIADQIALNGGSIQSVNAVDAVLDISDKGATTDVLIDGVKPEVTITSQATNPQSGAFTATFTFTEAVTGFESDDITVANGTADNFQTVSTSLYTATITPSADGVVTIDVAADKAADAAGNGNTVAAQLSVTNDETRPSATLSGFVTDLTQGAFTLTVDYDETVTGLELSDLIVSNGTAGSLTSIISGQKWSVDITPLADGLVTVNLGEGATTDAAGNTSEAAEAFTIVNDETQPVVTITSDATDPQSGAFMATFTFTESVTGFEAADVTVGNGEISNFQATSAAVYTAMVTPTADGEVTIDVAADKTTDEAGNPNAAATQFTLINDETAPTVSLTAGDLEAGAYLVTAQFSESVTGFELSDITITDGTSGTFTAVDGDTYTFLVSSENATAMVDIAAEVATDAAGNANTASNQLTLSFNSSPTDVILSNAAISENNTIGDLIGELSTTDADVDDTHVYTLVEGTGDTDNASFTIDGVNLRAAEAFDFETKDSYSIRVRTDDGRGGVFDKAFAITINNVGEPKVEISGVVDFPETQLGITVSTAITLTNTGEVEVEAVIVSTPAGFSVAPASVILAAGESRQVNVSFTPAEETSYSGDLVFSYAGLQVTHPVAGIGAIVTSIDDQWFDADDVKLYPNPASDILKVDLSGIQAQRLTITLINPAGTTVFGLQDYGKKELSLDVRGYDNGLYIMLFTDGKSVVRKKVMIKK